ncbi:MAG: hypothetical protein FWF67_06640 [Fibromonadales bacterium]|nr:hypothetical protein [Fibromonadales bacterium]
MGKKMKNPWTNLKADKNGKYISNDDKDIMPALEKKLVGKYKLHLELLPEPFIGNPKAPIYLLNLNPGFSKENVEEHKKNKKLRECIVKNNSHKPQKYPFYWLDPNLKETGGGKWWRRRLGPLLKKIGNDELVSKSIFCVEYFPYHSKEYKKAPLIPSQKYNENLIINAIKSNKLIIVMRNEEIYSEISDYEKHKAKKLVLCCKNRETPWISKGNFLDKAGFAKIISEIL